MYLVKIPRSLVDAVENDDGKERVFCFNSELLSRCIFHKNGRFGDNFYIRRGSTGAIIWKQLSP